MRTTLITACTALVVAIATIGAQPSDTLVLYGQLGPGPDYAHQGWYMRMASVYSKAQAESGAGGSPQFEIGSSFC